MTRASRGFTLLELLVVVGLIAVLSVVLMAGLRGGQSASLQSAQALLANLVTVARTKAAATGQTTRLLVQIDATSAVQPSRFLRYVVLQTQTNSGWGTIADASLSDGVYILPGNFNFLPAGLFSVDGTWTRADGAALRSTALRPDQFVTETVNSSTAEQWCVISFSSTGTTVQSGDLVLAAGRVRAPGSFATGESPIELQNPENVRGLTLSVYGLAILVNRRTSF